MPPGLPSGLNTGDVLKQAETVKKQTLQFPEPRRELLYLLSRFQKKHNHQYAGDIWAVQRWSLLSEIRILH